METYIDAQGYTVTNKLTWASWVAELISVYGYDYTLNCGPDGSITVNSFGTMVAGFSHVVGYGWVRK